MKATQIGFINAAPEIKQTREGIHIDWGTLELELTHNDIERLLITTMVVYPRAKEIILEYL